MPLNHKLEIRTQGTLFLFKLLEEEGWGAQFTPWKDAVLSEGGFLSPATGRHPTATGVLLGKGGPNEAEVPAPVLGFKLINHYCATTQNSKVYYPQSLMLVLKNKNEVRDRPKYPATHREDTQIHLLQMKLLEPKMSKVLVLLNLIIFMQSEQVTAK